MLLAGCDQARSTSASNATKTSSASEDAGDMLEFGPVYSAPHFADPVVEKTVQGAKTKRKVVSAEIRGFLADWVIRETSTSLSIVEFVVMKDGNVYRLGGLGRPSAASGWVPPTRQTPEPSREAKARVAALAVAHEVVAKVHPRYASVDPVVYNYLVRIHYKNGSNVDVWTEADVGNALFGPVYRVGAISDPFVAKAVSSIETTGSPAVSAEIAGYLVDWVLKSGSDQSIREYVVMKNGRLYDDGSRKNPAGAFNSGRASWPKSESQAEAQARKIALKIAQRRVAKIDSKYGKVDPLVYGYWLMIRRKDGSYINAWVGANSEVRVKFQRKALRPIEGY